MTFKDAAAVKLAFGTYRGSSLDDIATSDDGLKYLDWLRGQKWVGGRLREALTAYLEDPAIKRDLENILGA